VADAGLHDLHHDEGNSYLFEEIFLMTASARQREVVAAAVESLRPGHRQVLVVAYFQGRSVTETARALGLPVAVVKVRLYDAMHHLRRTLAVEGLPLHPTTRRDPAAA
jgi:DNA-directed RNA polymerase specialized sigma24 family protein